MTPRVPSFIASVSLLSGVGLVLFLSGCNTTQNGGGGYYTNRPWERPLAAHRPAAEAPSPLARIEEWQARPSEIKERLREIEEEAQARRAERAQQEAWSPDSSYTDAEDSQDRLSEDRLSYDYEFSPYKRPSSDSSAQNPERADALQNSAQQFSPGSGPSGNPFPAPASLSGSTGEPTIKVGILLPLSGDKARLGTAMLNAAQLALFDVGSTDFELLPRDTKGTPQGGAEAARSALDAGAQVLLGPVFSGAVHEAKKVSQRRGVSMIAFSTDWGLADRTTFMMGFLPFDQIDTIVRYASKENLRTIGILAPETPYGRAVASSFEASAAYYGVSVANVTYFPVSGSNISPLVRTFTKYDDRVETQKQKNGQITPPFDAVLIAVGGEQLQALANLLSFYDLGPDVLKRLGTGLWDDPSLAAEKNLAGGDFAAPAPENRLAFERRYTAVYGDTPPRLASLAYDATSLAAVLSRSAYGSAGRSAFRPEAIANPNGFSGIDGIFRFHPNGLVERGLAVQEFRGGGVVTVEPAPQTFQIRQQGGM